MGDRIDRLARAKGSARVGHAPSQRQNRLPRLIEARLVVGRQGKGNGRRRAQREAVLKGVDVLQIVFVGGIDEDTNADSDVRRRLLLRRQFVVAWLVEDVEDVVV